MSLRRFRYEPIRLGDRARAFVWIVVLAIVGWTIARVPYNVRVNTGGSMFQMTRHHWIWQKPANTSPPGWTETHTINWPRWAGQFACCSVPIIVTFFLTRDIVRDQRLQYNRCAYCGYEIRQLPRCPECGETRAM